MAPQFLENRTPQAYAAVERYDGRNSQNKNAGARAEAGALAWLVLGYAHYLDKDYANARAAWEQTGALQPLIGDYLDWLRANAFQGEAKPEAVMATLDGFDQRYPDSLNMLNAHIFKAGAANAT